MQKKQPKFVKVTNSTKWQGIPAENNVLTIADMDIPLDPVIRIAIMERLQKINNFTYKNKSKQYAEAIINWYRTRHIKEAHLEIKAEHIYESPSVINMVYMALQNFTKEGDGVLVLTPVWGYYQKITNFLNRKFVECPLYNSRSKKDFRYDINLTDFENKAKLCKVFIICNPHNPSGRLWLKTQIDKMLQICQKYGLLVISDEILSDLVPDQLRHKYYSLVNYTYPRLIVGNSISKAFNMESLKGGYAIIRSKELGQKYQDIVDTLSIRVNQFASTCLEIVYSEIGIQWLNRVASMIKNNYNYLRDKLKGTMAIISQYEGPYLIVINFEAYLKFIERWFYARKRPIIQQPLMIDSFLKTHQIHGTVQKYFSLNPNVYTQIRFTIAVEQTILRSFADKLRQVLLAVEYEHREICASL